MCKLGLKNTVTEIEKSMDPSSKVFLEEISQNKAERQKCRNEDIKRHSRFGEMV